jgi:hypothetical protein
MVEIVNPNGRESTRARDVSICELLDRVLNKGAVLTGELCISVADIELLYVGLSLVISSVETLIEAMDRDYSRTEQTVEIN